MAISWVQDAVAYSIATGNPLTSTLTFPANITAGDTVVVGIYQQGSSNRTYTVSDGLGSYTAVYNPAFVSGYMGQPEVWVCDNHPGGAATISVTHGSATASFFAAATVLRGFTGAISLAASDLYTDPSATDTHKGSSAGVSCATACVGFLIGGTGGSNFTDAAPSSGWTETPTGAASTDILAARQIFPTGVTGEEGIWTSTGILRQATTGIVLLTGSTGGGGGTGAMVLSWFGH